MTKLTSPSKLTFTYGALTFSAEGDADWCEKQLSAVLNATVVPADSGSSMSETQVEDILAFDAPKRPGHRPAPRRAADGPSDFSLMLTNYLKAQSVSNRRLNRDEGGGGRMPAQK